MSRMDEFEFEIVGTEDMFDVGLVFVFEDGAGEPRDFEVTEAAFHPERVELPNGDVYPGRWKIRCIEALPDEPLH